MAKQLNVDLNFNTNAKQAKAEIESLNNILKSIQSTPTTLFDDSSIKNASKAAQELQGHLSKAFDVNTGKLDLSRFSTSLKQSGKTLEDYRKTLSAIGPTGEQAFLAISKSIAAAETPTARVNKKMQEFATTLKNTARWQISSSILHGFMGAVQTAHGYAQDLDRSLNNIRIVTGQNADQMAQFAEEANRAAKALSTTTTEYTNASLIYYQQGLDAQQVKERSDITIKMANVSQQSAEIVSDQLTAVWNNFYDGSQSLEHYADAMTKLGADTASSSDEIAAGLEKFAAVGDMIGLSFDNAAAALATVTSQTRQSADVVGTAFKTIFARIQGLSLGETLDDGTNLNKYSQALMKVGINIKDASGQLKDMDIILEEMGAKWKTISKDQQVALAQTVAGVRQYNQLVSFMDNFDYYETLLDSAQNADGSLQKQADIYAQSWEAAQDRVKAAAEGVYDSLINKDFFIGFDNGLAEVLNGVEGFVDGLGGMKGIILTLSGIFMQYFAKQMPQALANLSANLSVFTGKAQQQANALQKENNEILGRFDVSGSDYQWNAQVQGITTINKMTSELAQKQNQLSEAERASYQAKIDNIKAIYEAVAARGKELNATKQQTEELAKQAAVEGAENAVVKEANKNVPKKSQKSKKEVLKESGSRKKVSDKAGEITTNLKALEKNIKSYEQLIQVQKKAQDQADEWKKQAKSIGDNANELEKLKERMRAYADSLTQADQNSQSFQEFLKLLESQDVSAEQLANAFALLTQNGSEAFGTLNADAAPFLTTIENLHQKLIELGVDPSKLNALEEQFRENAISAEEYEAALKNLEAQGEATIQHQVKMSEAVTSTVGAISSLGGVMTSVESAFDVFSDDDASAIQKIGAAIGLLTSAMSAYQGVVKAVTAIQAIYRASTSASAATQVAASGAIAGAKTAETVAIEANTAAWFSNPITAIIAAACLAAAAAIAVVSSAMEANSEKIAENADKWNEQAEAQKQTNEANRDTIASMREALTAYQEAQAAGDDLTSVKEELDSVTRTLADAYDLEGAALARLSGEYGAYESVLEKAIEKQKEELNERLNTEQQAANAVAAEMMDVSRDGNGRKSGDSYKMDFEGWGKNEYGAQDAIMKYVTGASKANAALGAGVHSVSFNTDFNDPAEMVRLYDELTKARAEMESTMSQKELADSGIYAETVEWLTRMEESVTEYKGHLDQVALIQAELGTAEGMTLSDTDVDSYSDFTQWAEEAEQAFINTGRSAEEAKELVKELVDNSLNPDLSGYYEMSQALDEIKATGTTVSDEVLEKLWTDAAEGEGAFDKAALAMVNWGTVTQDNYQEACEAAQAYYDAQQKITDAETISAGAETVSAEISKNGVTSDNADKVQGALDWGNEELGIIEFSEFLKMTADEQQTYLEELINGSQEDINQGLQDTIDSSQEIIDQQRQALSQYSAETQDAAQKTVNDWKLIQAEYNKYQQAVTAGTADEFVISDSLSNALSSSGVTWDDVLNAEDFDSYMQDKTKDAEVVLNTVANAEGLIKSAQSQIDAAEEQLEINALLDFAQSKEDVQGLVKELKGLEAGGTINADQYKVLSEYLPQLKKQFVETADGTYRLASGLDEVNLGWEDLKNLTHENGERLFSSEDIANSITDINELRDAYSNYAVNYSDYKTRLKDIVDTEMASATSLEELHNITQQALEFGAGVNYNTYAEALMRLGEQYSNCADEVEKYNKALLSGDDAQTKAAQSALELSIRTGELAEKYDLEAEALENYAERLQESVEGQELSAEAALNMAVASKRLDRGMGNVNKSFKDYKKILKDDNKLTSEYSETMDDLKSNLADIFNVADGDMFSDTFAKGLLDSETFEKALDGDIEALNSLRASAAVDIGDNIVADLGEAANVTQTEFKNAAGEIVNASYTAQSAWDYVRGVLSDGFTLSEINDAQFVESLNQMIQASGMTKDQVTSMLGSMGVSAKVVTSYKEQETEVPTYYEYSVNEGWSDFSYTDGVTGETVEEKRPKIRKMTVPGAPVKVKGYVPTYSLETSSGGTSSGGDIDYSSTFESASPPQASSSSTTSGVNSGGGGSSKATKDERQKKSSVVKRYKPIDDRIDDLTDALNDASKAADRLYGQDRLAAMKKANDLLDDEIALLKEKKTEADKYYSEDQIELQKAGADLGLTFNFDENGNISNYETALEQVWKTRESLLDTFGEEMDENEQKSLEELDKKIERLENAIDQFDETKELIEDLENEIEDAFYEWQDNNYEMLQLELELNLEVNENDLRMLELKLKQFGDNFYKMAEAAVLLGKDSVNNAKSQIGTYQSHKTDLDAAYAAGEISQADYMDGIKEVRDGIYEQLEALIDLDDQMMHYYRDTLTAAGEELANYTDHMEHLTGVFDHYLSLMEILGKQKDYNAMGDFLGGKAETVRDQLEVAQEYYEMLKENSKADEYWTNYQAALSAGDEDMAQWWKEQWDAETEALDEAQEKMLSLTEEWAEAMKAVIENNMNQIADVLEKSLTDGLGFDRLMDNFEKLNTRQEEYLTKTNQIYETNKLMRTASKALDETDNKVSKQKLKNFIDETKSLQENTKLSQYELEIQQAKYDLLLAEIALEEAQNAKSVVRLSRDNEGNFGYVYTADEDKIADAQQAVEDKENALYNISLEGQKDYTEKYLQAQQEMYNSLAELQQMYLNGEIATEEEFKARQAEIINHYFGEDGVLTTYSHLYNIAIQTDAAATQDFWAAEYGEMTKNTAEWQSAVDGYLIQIQEQTTNWKQVSEQANKDVKGALGDSKKATKELTEESETLRKKIVNDVIPAISKEIQSVQQQTSAYASQRIELLNLIETYKQYLATLNTQVAKANVGFDKNTDYSAVINDYLVDGGKVGDEAYNQLLAQRDAKIEWLKTDAGGNKTEEYWKTSGQATTDMYNKIYGTDDAWLNGDYFTDKELKEKLHALGIAGYATGGYTGDWGPEGKLAVLHEKELVLNSEDTDNLLKTVDFIREIVHMIDAQASMSSLFSMIATSGVLTNSETLEQTVTIHAEFPNATNHNEIEEAFNNLINTASQYANRK